MSEFHHVSVLLEECIEGLNIKPDGIYAARGCFALTLLESL